MSLAVFLLPPQNFPSEDEGEEDDDEEDAAVASDASSDADEDEGPTEPGGKKGDLRFLHLFE